MRFVLMIIMLTGATAIGISEGFLPLAKAVQTRFAYVGESLGR